MSVIGRTVQQIERARTRVSSVSGKVGKTVGRVVPKPVKRVVPAVKNVGSTVRRTIRRGSSNDQSIRPIRRPPDLTYTLFAGVNGAGKTSLYRILNKYEDLGVRVNIDEIVASEGTWKDDVLQIAASRKALKIIGDCIEKRQSFNQETTLPTVTVARQIKRARDAGYHVRLYFVGVENIQTAIKRVQRRVEKGGHGVDEKLIRQRFEKLPDQLREILPLVDSAFFYDNTVKFIQVAHVRNNVIVDCENDIPVWFWELIAAKKHKG